MGGQGRKTIITYNSPKRYRERCGLPKPLPLGEVALRSNDGEGKPGMKEPQAQRWAGFLSERYYRCARAVYQRPCPLSLVASSSPRPGCGSQRLLRCRSHPAGRCPNSSSLFPPLAAVVAVAPKGEPLACRSGSVLVQPLSLASLDSSPSRGASGETVHFAGPYRRGYFSNLFREFVENARLKREEFVNVIKMRRRY